MTFQNMGSLICDRRKAKNMTQKDLADALHVTDKAVSKWERGTSYPDINTIPNLARILDVSVDELMTLQQTAPLAEKTNIDTRQRINQIIDMVLKATGVGMGVAALVLSIMGNLEPSSAITMLAIGLTAMSIIQLRDKP